MSEARMDMGTCEAAGELLPRDFYLRRAEVVARELLGQRLVHVGPKGERLAGLIVETEAYLGGGDKAAHSYRGWTKRNAAMWLAGGHAYVYLIYGMHHCMNVVTGEEGDASAVLIRAVAPSEGLGVMRARRKAAKRETDLCSGPGKLCEALAIDRRGDGQDLLAGGPIRIERARAGGYDGEEVVAAPRIGIGYAEEWTDRPLRFYLAGSGHVSRR